MTTADADKWDAKYRAGDHEQNEPASVLSGFSYLLPKHGKALDLACGAGANALYLASRGLKTSAWDISTEAISRLRTRAKASNIILQTRVCDVTDIVIPAQSFDVITVSYFLERALFPIIINALHVNGLLFYQTWTRDNSSARGPHNENYRLGANELLQLCRDLRILIYCEEGTTGDVTRGLRDEAMLIGMRR